MTAQLHLFKSKRQRGIAPPPPLEFATQCQVADVLRRWAAPNWLWNHIPGGEERPLTAAVRVKRAGFQPGWSDFVLLPPIGAPIPQAHFLELKRRGECLSDSQVEFKLWCMLNRYPFEVAYSFKEAVDILKSWGAVRSNIRVQ